MLRQVFPFLQEYFVLLIQVLPFLLELFNLQLNLGKQILRILNRLPQVRNPAFSLDVPPLLSSSPASSDWNFSISSRIREVFSITNVNFCSRLANSR